MLWVASGKPLPEHLVKNPFLGTCVLRSLPALTYIIIIIAYRIGIRLPSHCHLLFVKETLFLSSERFPASNQHGLTSLFKCHYHSSYNNINKCSLTHVSIFLCVCVCVCVCACVEAKGWAVESRVYAEDPYRGFLPSIGPLVTYKEPTLEVNNAGVYAPTCCQCLCMHVRVTD
jgi:hypothetical protein